MYHPSFRIRRLVRITLLALAVPALAYALRTTEPGPGIKDPDRTPGITSARGIWIDMYRGGAVSEKEMVKDLGNADVIYIGETHTISRHHSLEQMLVSSMCENGKRIVVAMEQLEKKHQAFIERFNCGDISFNELAANISWEKTWSNYRDYRGVLETARTCGARIIGMNASAEVVKKVARKGIPGLGPVERALLPADIDTGQGHYRELLGRLLMVHSHMGQERIDRYYEAQVSRDETMASVIAGVIAEGPGVRVVAIGGSMHFSWGLGVPARVSRRVPGVKDRIVILSESGELELSPVQKAMAGRVIITHQDLKKIPYPLADYLHIMCGNTQTK